MNHATWVACKTLAANRMLTNDEVKGHLDKCACGLLNKDKKSIYFDELAATLCVNYDYNFWQKQYAKVDCPDCKRLVSAALEGLFIDMYTGKSVRLRE